MFFPVEPSGCRRGALHMMEKLSNSPLVPWKYRCGQRTVRNGRCGMQPKPSSLKRRRIKVKAELETEKQRL
ncbi:hypothetical protein TNCV_1211931 [Trichonephila clavipes]|nr:hypothetical protein TNCV_1211931 [Trichonephila clavipes]